ncbi:MAG TPA: hypothetical protein VOA41_18250 [Candidatus Dormibacteraeota bacterium]|nr:hypothetical protein [Candidatus Dormibacteraeota bacterium]
MFRVNRSSLLSDVWSQTHAGSALVTGSPGSGKSWLVAQIVRTCIREKRPHLAIIAEDYPVRSLEELRLALGFTTDILTFLQSLPGDPLLIIDGLDSLRSDPSQRSFRKLIRKLPSQAPKCSVVASIRSFDLRQSEEFQSLFFSPSSPFRDKPFREIAVAIFSDDELADVSRQLPALRPLLEKAEGEFRQLLRNPFNLHLAAELVQSGTPASEITPLRSQVQLLTKYWSWRLDTPPDHYLRKGLLRDITRTMVDKNSLSVAEADIALQQHGSPFSALQSDEVLRQSVTNRISFTHNILFDYAAARLLLDEETVVAFIEEDPSRTIFFRPSLAYFFHYLWLRDRALFWKTAFLFFESTTLPERARVIPAVTIYEASQEVEDLKPILSASSRAELQGIAGTLRAVQALGGLLSSNRRKLWLNILTRLASNPAIAFINEFTGLLNLAEETKTTDEAPTILVAASQLLRWIWNYGIDRGRSQAISLADFGAARVLHLVLKNYATDSKVARETVLAVLDRYGAPKAAANEAFRLANEIKNIIRHDPLTAIEVYRRTFAYNEASEETTQLGGGAALSLRSTRKQDFSTALYVLQAAFPVFLETAPEQAATAAVEAVNAEIGREKPLKPPSESDSPMTFDFLFEGKRLTYRADYSEIWDSGSREYLSLNLLNATLHQISDASDTNGNSAKRLFHLIVEHASLAVIWKRLLQIATTRITAWYPTIRELLFIPEFISAPETTILAGQTLQSIYAEHLVSSDDALAIERAILNIPNARVILRYEKPESIRDRLLMSIPQEGIRSPEAVALAERLKAQTVRENKPYHSSSFFQRPFGTEDWLKERGVDTTKHENAEVLEALKPLEEFESKYLNEVPTTEVCRELEPALTKIETLLADLKPAEELAATARGLLCSAAESVLKNPKLSAADAVLRHCRQIALRGARDPVPNFNPKYHLPFDMPGWGSFQPRIEAAQGLAHYLWNWGLDPEVVEALRLLSRDPVPAVRFQVAQGILGFWRHKATDEFWTFFDEMISKEQTPGVLIALAGAAGQIAVHDPKRVALALSAAIERGVLRTERSDLSRSFLQILVGLYVAKNDAQSNNQLLQFEANPVEFEREMAEGIYAASGYLTPDTTKELERRGRARELLIRALVSVYRSLEAFSEQEGRLDKPESFGKLLHIIEAVATRVYHTLDISPYRTDGASAMEQATRKALYFELKPVLEFLTVRRSLKGQHYLAPHTAHQLMQTLNVCLLFDPAPVIQFAAAACRAASVMSYHFDSDSIQEIVKLVEHVLADHRDVLREPPIAKDLGEMLDLFVSAGWPQAMSLTFRLDEAIR